MRASRNPLAILVLAMMLALAACGSGDAEVTSAGQEPADEREGEESETADSEAVEPETAEPSDDTTAATIDPVSSEPPPVELSRGDDTVSLTPWSYCWTAPNSDAGICADGAPPERPKVLAGDGPITLRFPADFTFAVTVYDAEYANEVGSASIVADGDAWQIDPETDGPAVLQIFGNGPEGDVSVSVALS